MDFKKLSPGIKKNVLLKNYTTFRIGGKAKYFFVAKTKKEVISIILATKKYNLPFFILGGGSNILVSDERFEGLVIKIQNFHLRLSSGSQAKLKTIYAEAGTLLGQLVNFATKNNLTGLECTIGIPGTIGGAIGANAGAFGKSISDIVEEVEVFDSKTEKIRIFQNKDCRFDYRDSIFKHKKNLIILSVVFQLRRESSLEIKKKMKEYLNYRKETQPLNFPSAGSIFKNFIPHRNEVSGAGPTLKMALKKFSRKNLIPAAYLIEKCKLKGKKIGKAQISKKHANFLLNLGGASADDVKKLIELIKQTVKKKFGVELEEEIQYLGF